MDVTWIREGLKKPGKTQRGLAAALRLDPAAINRLLAGTRQLKASEVEKVAAYLEVRLQGIHVKSTQHAARTLPPGEAHEMLEVRGMAEGGPDGWNLWNGDVIQYIPRPANLIGVTGAYAVYVLGTSMEPRYNQGELAHIHPSKPVTPGSYVLVQKKPKGSGEPPYAVIKQLVRRSGSKIVLASLSPAKEFEIKADEVQSMHRVVGSSEA